MLGVIRIGKFVAAVVAVTALAACNVIEADAPDADPVTGLGKSSGGLLGQTYDERLAKVVADASAVCAKDVGEVPGTIDHELCVYTVLGTPQVELADFAVPEDGRWEPIIWLDSQWGAFRAYRARFAASEEGQGELMVRMADFLERQKTLLAMREGMIPVEPESDY